MWRKLLILRHIGAFLRSSSISLHFLKYFSDFYISYRGDLSRDRNAQTQSHSTLTLTADVCLEADHPPCFVASACGRLDGLFFRLAEGLRGGARPPGRSRRSGDA